MAECFPSMPWILCSVSPFHHYPTHRGGRGTLTNTKGGLLFLFDSVIMNELAKRLNEMIGVSESEANNVEGNMNSLKLWVPNKRDFCLQQGRNAVFRPISSPWLML